VTMARPQRKNVDYFPFLLDRGYKASIIDQRHGNDGFATWVRLLCELGRADFHYLDLRDESKVMYMAATCLISEEKLVEIIEDLVRLHVFDPELWSSRILFSEKFVESVSDAYAKRSNPAPTRSMITRMTSAGESNSGGKPGLGDGNEGLGTGNRGLGEHLPLKDRIEEDRIGEDRKPGHSKACVFSESSITISDLKSNLTRYPDTDFEYYFNRASDWSREKNKKRRDWIATIRNMISGDEREGKRRVNGNLIVTSTGQVINPEDFRSSPPELNPDWNKP